MITNFLHKTMLLAAICLGCISCSDETAPQQTMPDNSNGQVKIVYKIAGASSLSRAETTPEPGWSGDWHENLITRIDLFVFTADGDLYKHIEATGNPLVDKTEDTYTTLETDELTYEEVIEADYTYYMVANCPQLADIEETGYTFSDLESAMITPALDFDATQESFVMDGIGERSGDKLNITLSFDLARAATKICLAVVDEEGTDITNECKYRFFNYVSTGTSVMAESEKYGEGTNQSRTSMTETDEDSFTPLRYDKKDENIHQVVFYSYPNDWFDTDKLSGEKDNWVIADYATEDPITGNQTYILLTAPYDEDGKSYYYKIPVNFATYKNNDKVSFTDAELKEIRDLYRMKRNHIYDITAKIDRRGGGLDLVTRVYEWYDGGSIDINYADNYAGALNVISDTPLTTGTGEDEAYAVVYGDNNKVATFTFRMTTPAGATWTANLTNGSQFELTSTSGIASGVGVGADENDPNEGLVTFSVRPTQDYDPGTVRETELYITVTNANGERLGEQIINPDEEYPGSTTRIKIRQVSLDQWNNLQ